MPERKLDRQIMDIEVQNMYGTEVVKEGNCTAALQRGSLLTQCINQKLGVLRFRSIWCHV